MAEADAGLELPIGLTEQRFLQQLARIEAGAIRSAKRQEQGFVRSNQNITKSFSGMSNAARSNLQNVSYQLQDIFVQIQGGQGAVRALSQQLPQMLGGLGAMGAVMGLVVAAAAPLAGALFSLGRDSEDAADMAEEFDKSLQSARSALEDFNATINTQALGSVDALIEKYGRADEAVRQLEDRMRAAFKSDAFDGFQEAVDEKALGALIGSESRVAQVFERVMDLRRQAEAAQGDLQSLQDLQASTNEWVAGPLIMNARMEIEAAREEAARLNEEVAKTGVTPEQIATFNEAKDALDAAFAGENFNAAADAVNEIQGVLRSTSDGELVTIADQLDRVQRSLREAAAEAGELPPELDAAANAAADVSFAVDGINFDGAIDGAYDLAGALATAASQLAALESRQASAAARANIRKRYAGDSVGEAGAMAGLEFSEALPDRAGPHDVLTPEQRSDFEARREAYVAEAEAIARTEQETQALIKAQREAAKGGGGGSGKRSGGGGGGGSRARSARQETPFFEGVEKDLIALERRIELIGKTDAETAKLKATWDLLDEAKKRGLDLDAKQAATGLTLREEIERQADSVGRLAEKYQQAEAQAQFYDGIQESLKDGLIDTIVEGESFAGVMENVAKALAKAALQAALFGEGPLANMFGGGGAGGGLLGSLIGSLMPGRAAGGPVTAGRPYMVGERGPEPFIPAVNGRILSVSQAQAALRGGRGGAVNFAPSTSITIQGSADEKTLSQIRRELDVRDARIKSQVPGIMQTFQRRAG